MGTIYVVKGSTKVWSGAMMLPSLAKSKREKTQMFWDAYKLFDHTKEGKGRNSPLRAMNGRTDAGNRCGVSYNLRMNTSFTIRTAVHPPFICKQERLARQFLLQAHALLFCCKYCRY